MASMRGLGSGRMAGRMGGAALAALLATSVLTPAPAAELSTNPVPDFPNDFFSFVLGALVRPPVLARDGSVALVWTDPGEDLTFGLWDGGEPQPITVSDYPFYGVGLSYDGSRYVGTVNVRRSSTRPCSSTGHPSSSSSG